MAKSFDLTLMRFKERLNDRCPSGNPHQAAEGTRYDREGLTTCGLRNTTPSPYPAEWQAIIAPMSKPKLFRIKRYTPDRPDPEGGNKHVSPLAICRWQRGVKQQAMADALGIGLSTYRRLERGHLDDPGVRVLHNCAILLGVTLEEILPPAWARWTAFSSQTPQPAAWVDLWDFRSEHHDFFGIEFELPVGAANDPALRFLEEGLD